jgi:hypothetical protein
MLPLLSFYICVYMCSIDDNDERERMKFLSFHASVFLAFCYIACCHRTTQDMFYFFSTHIYACVCVTVKCVCAILSSWLLMRDGNVFFSSLKDGLYPAANFHFPVQLIVIYI